PTVTTDATGKGGRYPPATSSPSGPRRRPRGPRAAVTASSRPRAVDRFSALATCRRRYDGFTRPVSRGRGPEGEEEPGSRAAVLEGPRLARRRRRLGDARQGRARG